jgi:uncharacterized membrane protein YbhN (UPF0104 family)
VLPETDERPGSAQARAVARTLPWIGTALVLVLVLQRVDVQETWRILRLARPAPLGAALLGWALIQAASILRWWGVERLAGDAGVTMRDLTRSHLVGMSVNLFLPSGFGGDIARALRRRSEARGLLRAARGVVADRFLALHALLVAAAFGIAATPALQQRVSPQTLGVMLILGSLPFAWPWLQAWRRRTPPPTASQAGGTLALWVLSVLIQFANAVVHAWLLDALWPGVPRSWMLAVIPAMSLLASLPVSINGLGVREGLLMLWLAPVGVPEPVALALGVLSLGLLVVAGLAGGLVLLGEALAPSRAGMA